MPNRIRRAAFALVGVRQMASLEAHHRGPDAGDWPVSWLVADAAIERLEELEHRERAELLDTAALVTLAWLVTMANAAFYADEPYEQVGTLRALKAELTARGLPVPDMGLEPRVINPPHEPDPGGIPI
jgi:hypothetical protein